MENEERQREKARVERRKTDGEGERENGNVKQRSGMPEYIADKSLFSLGEFQ